MIEVKGLRFSHIRGRHLQFPDFHVRRGESFLLLGESGSGKTTLLHLLGGLLGNYAGSIEVDGVSLKNLSQTSLDKFRGQRMGFVFQRSHLIQALTVERNILLSSYLAGLPSKKRTIKEVLESLDLGEKRKSKVSQLSEGQIQRVAIARAIINKPSVILADEPTSALDDKNCNRVIQLLMRVASENQSALLVATHDQRLKTVFEKQIVINS